MAAVKRGGARLEEGNEGRAEGRGKSLGGMAGDTSGTRVVTL